MTDLYELNDQGTEVKGGTWWGERGDVLSFLVGADGTDSFHSAAARLGSGQGAGDVLRSTEPRPQILT